MHDLALQLPYNDKPDSCWGMPFWAVFLHNSLYSVCFPEMKATGQDLSISEHNAGKPLKAVLIIMQERQYKASCFHTIWGALAMGLLCGLASNPMVSPKFNPADNTNLNSVPLARLCFSRSLVKCMIFHDGWAMIKSFSCRAVLLHLPPAPAAWCRCEDWLLPFQEGKPEFSPAVHHISVLSKCVNLLHT